MVPVLFNITAVRTSSISTDPRTQTYGGTKYSGPIQFVPENEGSFMIPADSEAIQRQNSSKVLKG